MVAAVGACRSDLMATELGCARAPAGAVAGLSAARGHRLSKVRSGTHMHMCHTCTCTKSPTNPHKHNRDPAGCCTNLHLYLS